MDVAAGFVRVIEQARLKNLRKAGLSFSGNQIAQKGRISEQSRLYATPGNRTAIKASLVSVRPCPKATRLIRLSRLTACRSMAGRYPGSAKFFTTYARISGPSSVSLTMNRRSRNSSHVILRFRASASSDAIATNTGSSQRCANSHPSALGVPARKATSRSRFCTAEICVAGLPSTNSGRTTGWADI